MHLYINYSDCKHCVPLNNFKEEFLNQVHADEGTRLVSRNCFCLESQYVCLCVPALEAINN